MEIERAYRIVGALEETGLDLRDRAIPALIDAVDRHKRLTWIFDAILFSLLAVGVIALGANVGFDRMVTAWKDFPGTDLSLGPAAIEAIKFAIVAVMLWFLHSRMRRLAAWVVRRGLTKKSLGTRTPLDLSAAFAHSTRTLRPMWLGRPAGWSKRAERRLHDVLADTTGAVQALNDAFARPSGQDGPTGPAAAAPAGTEGKSGT